MFNVPFCLAFIYLLSHVPGAIGSVPLSLIASIRASGDRFLRAEDRSWNEDGRAGVEGGGGEDHFLGRLFCFCEGPGDTGASGLSTTGDCVIKGLRSRVFLSQNELIVGNGCNP